MGKATAISYCHSTINPTVGCLGRCELYSPDPTKNLCYAKTLVDRYAGLKGWPKSFEEPKFFPGRMEKALAWGRPTSSEIAEKRHLAGCKRIIFVGDLSDIFNCGIDPEWLYNFISDMECSSSIWLLLTKNPWAMADLFAPPSHIPDNVWLGTTVTDNATACRADVLADIINDHPNVHLWLSLEPVQTALTLSNYAMSRVSWITMGGASGPNGQAVNSNTVSRVKDECVASGVPFFYKQLGGKGRSGGTPVIDGQVYHQMPTAMLE